MSGQRKYLDPYRRFALTQRQAEIAGMAARGMSNGDIARDLVISRNTVRNILVEASEKLGVSGRVALAVLLKRGQQAHQGRGASRDVTVLSPREREVAELVARGLTNMEIARQLNISYLTVKNHMSHILAKLGMADRIELVLLVERGTEETNGRN